MTIEELAKLKKGDRLMWGDNAVTMDRFHVVVNNGGYMLYLDEDDIKEIELLTGPTLPPHVAEVFEWDGKPKRVVMEGWSWAEDLSGKVCYGPRYGNAWGVIPKIRKEAE